MTISWAKSLVGRVISITTVLTPCEVSFDYPAECGRLCVVTFPTNTGESLFDVRHVDSFKVKVWVNRQTDWQKIVKNLVTVLSIWKLTVRHLTSYARNMISAMMLSLFSILTMLLMYGKTEGRTDSPIIFHDLASCLSQLQHKRGSQTSILWCWVTISQ